jgi:hypothetical protein
MPPWAVVPVWMGSGVLIGPTVPIDAAPPALRATGHPRSHRIHAIERRRSGATRGVMRLPPGRPSGSGSVSCAIIWAIVAMPSGLGGLWTERHACGARHRCPRSTSSSTRHNAPAHALGSPHSRSKAALRRLCPTRARSAASISAAADLPSSAAAKPTAVRRAWPRRFNVASPGPAPHHGVEPGAAHRCLAPKPPVCSAIAIVRANKTVATSCA